MKNYQDIAAKISQDAPRWSLIEDDVSLASYILKTQLIDLTLEEVEQVRVHLDKE